MRAFLFLLLLGGCAGTPQLPPASAAPAVWCTLVTTLTTTVKTVYAQFEKGGQVEVSGECEIKVK
jgi:hypothetical protein